MAKVVLGKTPQDLEKEQAKREREMEAELQQTILERQKKIQALHSKQKTNKIIIILVVVLIAGILITFGTYNTFFKKGITLEDVDYEIAVANQTNIFPSEGLDGYIRDNCDALFERYMRIDPKRGKDIASVEVDKNSCSIYKVRKLNATLAQVYYSFDVIVTKKDVQVTDPGLIEQIKRNGLGAVNNQPTTAQQVDVTESTETTAVETTEATEEVTETTDATNESEAGTDTNTEEVEGTEETEATEEIETTEETEATTEATEATSTDATEDTQQPDNSTPITDFDYSVNNQTAAKHYYITSGGQIWESGEVSVVRYNFYVPIQLVYTYTTDEEGNQVPVTAGFALAGEASLYGLQETNQTTFDDENGDGEGGIQTHDVFKFEKDGVEIPLADEETTGSVKIKVEKTLQDLYDKRDTSQDFLNYYKFNTYEATFSVINELLYYTDTNAMGYNVKVSYDVITSQGFTITVESYMYVEKSGNSWVIKKMT